jgi:hypothetical protein
VAFTTPDGEPVLRRPLSALERKRLTAQAADLKALLAPCCRALARITAVINAQAAGQVMASRGYAPANVFFGSDGASGGSAPVLPPLVRES